MPFAVTGRADARLAVRIRIGLLVPLASRSLASQLICQTEVQTAQCVP